MLLSEIVPWKKKVTEMSIAGRGDMDSIELEEFNAISFFKKYSYLCDMSTGNYQFKLYTDGHGDFKVGLAEDDVFYAVASFRFDPMGTFSTYGNAYEESDIRVVNQLQGQGIAKRVYLYIIHDMHITIVGDQIQFHGARKLWTKLSNYDDIVADIVDLQTGEILHKNVTLHHGGEDDFDARLWSRDQDMNHIRAVIRKIL